MYSSSTWNKESLKGSKLKFYKLKAAFIVINKGIFAFKGKLPVGN